MEEISAHANRSYRSLGLLAKGYPEMFYKISAEKPSVPGVLFNFISFIAEITQER